MAQIVLDEGAAASTPAANKVSLYAKADGNLYSKDDAGTESSLSAPDLTNYVTLIPTVAPAASPDIFAAAGATINLSGAAVTITSFANCTTAQVGSVKRLIPAANANITASANLIVDGATSGTYVMPANARMEVLATSISTFVVTTIFASGTWVPSVGGTATYSTQVGTWTKTGNRVSIDALMILTALGTGSTTTISGIPFVSANNSMQWFGQSNTANCATAVVSEQIYVIGNSATLQFGGRTAANISPTNPLTMFGNTTAVRFSVGYQV
jgi:hypothetical protein